jgi:HAD superfamily hydrolase (TIGR01509 family)
VPREAVIECIGLTAEDTEVVLRNRCGPSFPYEHVLAERLRIGRDQVHTRPAPVKAGVRELLTYLRTSGLKTAIATSTDRARTTLLLDKSELGPRFDATVCREDVARRKPAPDVYLEAARRVQCVPERCLVIEDSDTGLLAAHRAGMRAVFVEDLKPLPREAAWMAVARFGSLVAMSEALAGRDGQGVAPCTISIV